MTGMNETAATTECPDTEVLTQHKFATYVSYIAKNANNWVGEILTDYRYLGREMDADVVARFTDDIRGRLDMLDSMVGRSSSRTATQPDP